ncbi:thiopeptide-type bacteriocin biosynthesis protein [Niabella sp. CJ426]|uniref:lantibiotic dehydratase n=1 Tax=Niabella sp. CJ426 TaxID=3393740 RepID=UPI003D062FB0
MTKLELNDQVLIRTPRFSFTDRLSDKWDELKLLIKEASPDLYSVIKNLDYQSLVTADAKVRLAVNKYFNRARFRSTPFGAFATVSLNKFSNTSAGCIELAEKPIIHSFTDWTTPTPQDIDSISDTKLLFFANTSYYRVLDELRFIQRQGENYVMAAIDFDPLIIDILVSCQKPISFSALLTEIRYKVSQVDLETYLSELYEVQLVLTNRSRNIIGEDYFNRTQSKCNHNKQYIIAERTSLGGAISKQPLHYLPELAATLQRITSVKASRNLLTFKNQFIKKYEQAEIPVMEALDPDIGIGYGNMAQHDSDKALSPFLIEEGSSVLGDDYSGLRDRLFRSMLCCKRGDAINLESLIPGEEPSTILPNTISAGVVVADDQVFLEYMGGATANSILGRFALAVPGIGQYCNELAEWEKAANPGVLFFDVGYTKEDAVDNVNRRPAIYDLQLNILNYDTSASPLSVFDLTVSIHRDEIILRSQTLNTRLMPRLATAYNYQRSDLPLFRLLMDIQNQGLSTALSFRPVNLIPDLPHYPRIQFKNIIVAPACWQLSTQIFEGINSQAPKLSVLTNYLQTTIPSRFLKTGIADQTLLFDSRSVDDVALLLSILLKDPKGKIHVEEVALPESPVVIDELSRPYLAQLILTLQHAEPVVAPLTVVQRTFPSLSKRQWIPPGLDWLYFEIYSSPNIANDLLVRKIRYYLDQFRSGIAKWFFIRYNENGQHLRLRLQIEDLSSTATMITALATVLEPELESGIVSDIKLCTYKKETHRYLPGNMGQVEHHFYTDSEFVISMIQSMLSDNHRYQLCMGLFDCVANSGLIEPANVEHLIGKLADSYNAEHVIRQPQFKAINSRYKAFRQETMPSLNINSTALYERMKQSMIETLNGYPKLVRPKIFADLMHMHINRLFATEQRTHEMVFYNFLALERKNKKYSGKTDRETMVK